MSQAIAIEGQPAQRRPGRARRERARRLAERPGPRASFVGHELDPEIEVPRDVSELLEQGIEHCRRGDWARGLRRLLEVADNRRHGGSLPSFYYSYLGHAIAVEERRLTEGLRLCRHAVKAEFFQLDNYVNLARTCMLADRRREAYKAVARGLSIDAEHPELLALHKKLGTRRPPVLRFLSRHNPVNRLLGRLRHGPRDREQQPSG